MLEKGKKYTYDELEKIIKEVERKVVTELDNDMKDVTKDSEKRESMSSLMFSMQNMLVASMMSQMLLEKEEVK